MRPSHYQNFESWIQEKYPELTPFFSSERFHPLLISEANIELPLQVLKSAESIVRACYEIRSSLSYREYVQPKLPPTALKIPNYDSVPMSFDFHVSPENNLKLIEINTNASALPLSTLLNEFYSPNQTRDSLRIHQIADLFIEQWKKHSSDPLETIAIIDEAPSQQKAFYEFLLYQKLFEDKKIRCQIYDVDELFPDANNQWMINENKERFQLIYNRLTDFYLDLPGSGLLRQGYLHTKTAFIHNPADYGLLADKYRMPDLTAFLESTTSIPEETRSLLRSVLLRSTSLTAETKDDLWANRKNYFFKPYQSHGSKSVYRGKSISHRTFDSLVDDGIMAQELAPPGKVSVTLTNDETHEMSYDLRFFTVGNQIISVVARVYEGQLTNFATPGGGFSTVSWQS